MSPTQAAGKEVVLPSGAFASMRPVKYRDMLAVHAKMAAIGADKQLMLAYLLAEVVCIDGTALTVEQVLDTDSRDIGVLLDQLKPYMKGPVK